MTAIDDTPYDDPMAATAPTEQSLERKSVKRVARSHPLRRHLRNSPGLRLYLLMYSED
jgi:hypothetical protein